MHRRGAKDCRRGGRAAACAFKHSPTCGRQRRADRRRLRADRAWTDAGLRRAAHHQFCAWRAADGGVVCGILHAQDAGRRSLCRRVRPDAGIFWLGYGLQRFVIGPASHGNDGNILLVTLGLAVIIENALLFAFRADTRTIDVPYGFSVVPVAGMFLSVPRLVGFGGAVVVALLLWLLLGFTDTGKAIRAVAKEKLGAQLCGIDVAHIYAVTFGLGTACVAIAACLLLPTYYVNPHVGNAFVLIAFTTVVLGGMGSIPGALIGGLFVGVVESLCGLYLGESLGQIGIFLMFILVLLFRPSGFLGERA